MIYDRTETDVNNAVLLRKKLQLGLELSEAETSAIERGTITINTLNRIENKQDELKILLNSAGYFNTPIINKNWTYSDIFDNQNFQRLIDNLNILRNAFFVYADTPKTPSVSYHFEDINSLEKILEDIETMIADMRSRYRQCGTFQCGEVNKN